MAQKFEVSNFGNGVLTGSGGNVVSKVHTKFQGREVGEQAGVLTSDDAYTQVTFTLTGSQLVRDKATDDAFLVPVVIPAGAVISDVIVRTKEVFVLGGTTPTILVGTQGSEATNGFVVSQAQAQAVGTVLPTKVGTWASPLAAATTIGVALGGTSPTVTAAGKLDVLIRYVVA